MIETKLFNGYTYRAVTHGLKLSGMIPTRLRKIGFTRAKGKPVFFYHGIGIGGIYVTITEDHVIVQVRGDMSKTLCFTDTAAVMRYIHSLLEIDSRVRLMWTRKIQSSEKPRGGSKNGS